MDLAPVLARLKAQVTAVKAFGLAADFAAATTALSQHAPGAYLLNLAERGGPNGLLLNAVSQQVSARIGVVMAIQNLRDIQGEAAQADLDPIRVAVRTALLGWQPASADSPFTYAGGRLLAMKDNVLWWQDDYETTYYVRSV